MRSAAMKKPAPLADRVTDYARAVVSGAIVAGPHVRASCARHLRDLVEGPARGLYWDLEKADRAIRFFPAVLRLNGGEFENVPFDLLDWQAFIVGSLFGWMGATGYRRFRVGFVEAGKGAGKSPLSAGIGLYMMLSDAEARAEIYAAASKKDQAMILFRDAVAMVKQSPALSSRMTFAGGAGREWNIAHSASSSFFRPIANDDGASGPRPHCALIDEIHEHKDANTVEMMRAGTKGRRQALIFMITNSGVDRTSVCYQYHEYGGKVADGSLQDDSFFSYICALDENDDPFTDESCWIKANPSLGITIQLEYLREQVTQARGMPSKESIVRRLNFSQWVDAASPWIAGDLWRACESEWDLSEVEGLPAFLALDLSGTRDLTAAAAVWPRDNGNLDAAVWFFAPAEGVDDRARESRVPYDAWARAGHIELTPGRAVDYSYVARLLGDLTARFDVRSCAYDPYRIKYLEIELDSAGVGLSLVSHGQGFFRAQESGLWMPRSVELLERAVFDGRLRVKYNPVLSWNSASAVLVQDAKHNRVFDKRKSSGKIDGLVSLCMAVGLASESAGEADISEFLLDPVII